MNLNSIAEHFLPGSFWLIGEVVDSGELRILEAARVYRLLGDPWVILSGGYPEITDRPQAAVISRDALIQLGVTADRIL